jgi:hypothetical protein
MSQEWVQKITEFCERYNIPILYLADTLYEPKVVPMIRGKAFEFSVVLTLKEILPKNEWKVYKANIGEEVAFHDTDVRVLHKRTGKVIRVECKLAQKEGYRLYSDGHSQIRIKCMRSRTLGKAKAKEFAPKLGLAPKLLEIHNDQYLPADFDVVITSIGNAFYRTDEKSGLTGFSPTERELDFLLKLGCSREENARDFAFQRMYIAKSSDLAVRPDNKIVCTRRKCKNKTNCGFIPDYPIIEFDTKGMPTNQWMPIDESANIFRQFIG